MHCCTSSAFGLQERTRKYNSPGVVYWHSHVSSSSSTTGPPDAVSDPRFPQAVEQSLPDNHINSTAANAVRLRLCATSNTATLSSTYTTDQWGTQNALQCNSTVPYFLQETASNVRCSQSVQVPFLTVRLSASPRNSFASGKSTDIAGFPAGRGGDSS